MYVVGSFEDCVNLNLERSGWISWVFVDRGGFDFRLISGFGEI